MRVALIHNRGAGGSLTPKKLHSVIEAAGHELVRALEKVSDLDLAAEDEVDVVAVAGGDGTVRSAVRALAGKRVPIAILPLGTANNIAVGLGIEGSPRRLARRWPEARRVPVDLGGVRGPWGQSRFIEGVGFGLVPESILAAKEVGKRRLARSAGGAIRSARRLYRRILSRLEPVPLSLTADGEKLDGEYLLIQVLNIPSVGPNLRLAPDSSPSDGFLDLVTAGEKDRDAVRVLLDKRSRPEDVELPRRRVREVEIGDWRTIHVDDELQSSEAKSLASIAIEPAGVEFLV